MKKVLLIIFSIALALCSCTPPAPTPAAAEGLKVLAIESFLADIAQNVAGERLKIQTLIPLGLDPHAFEPNPLDVVNIAGSDMLILNGGGVEEFLDRVLQNTGGQQVILEASAGLPTRTPRSGELIDPIHAGEGDPHFWLDPLQVIGYVENMRAAFSAADPQGSDTYAKNAQAYTAQLKALDARLQALMQSIPPERRLLVTNHESFGYFADRYGLRIIGTVIPSVSTGASPSAQQLVSLVERIRQSGAPAIFLETGSNPQLAEQLSTETGVKVVADLYTHSLTPPGGAAPTYIAMMEYNAARIVEALR